MAHKIEHIAFPTDGKKNNGEDFEDKLQKARVGMGIYASLKEEYLLLLKRLEGIKKEYIEAQKSGKLSAQDKKPLENTIAAMEEELGHRDYEIKYIAKKAEGTVRDPRYVERKWDEIHSHRDNLKDYKK